MKKLFLVLLLIFCSIKNFAQTAGQPVNLTNCDAIPSMCFDLSVNTPNILGTLNPANYTVTYHSTSANATSGANPLPLNFCAPSNPYTVFGRLTNGTIINTSSFSLAYSSYETPLNYQLSDYMQCDNNNDGSFVFNLSSVQTQINTNNPLVFYTTLADAQGMINPISNPNAYTLTMQAQAITIFIREVVAGSCDLMRIVQLHTLSNCNVSSGCGMASSLCGFLGFPFANTVNVPNTGPLGCLNTTPNGKWFYLPISNDGRIDLNMVQNSDGGTQIDVDYILYGPFTSAVAPCSNLNQLYGSMVSCSYSTAAIENATILNAQQGQYYLLLITNFSNQQGNITITQPNIGQPGSGSIGCSGLRFNAFFDNNTNGVKDNGEPDFPVGEFQYEKNNNGIIHHITAPSGTFEIYDSNTVNSYDVSFAVPAYPGMYTVSSPFNNLTVPTGAGFTTYYFAVTPQQLYNDVEVAIVPINAPRPGFVYANKIVYTNNGNQNVPLGTLTFVKDANLSVVSNSQSGTLSTSSGFTYDFTNLAPFESRFMIVSMQVPTIPTVNAGQFLTNSVSIVPITGDVLPGNNLASATEMIINAYDPNDKMESHGDRILHSSFTSNDYLYYTIRFENTGNASAWNIRINDLLDPQLDETTLRMVSASHAYELDRVGNSLTWNFDSIQLPVSVPNTDIGKGYVTFKIKPNPGYAIGDIITNEASIYFDFNPAIVTNLFSTQFVALGNTQFETGDFILHPNPTSELVTISLTQTENTIASIVVYDVLGKTILTEKVSDVTTQTIDVSSFNSGMYFIEVTTNTNVKVLKKLMVN